MKAELANLWKSFEILKSQNGKISVTTEATFVTYLRDEKLILHSTNFDDFLQNNILIQNDKLIWISPTYDPLSYFPEKSCGENNKTVNGQLIRGTQSYFVDFNDKLRDKNCNIYFENKKNSGKEIRVV